MVAGVGIAAVLEERADMTARGCGGDGVELIERAVRADVANTGVCFAILNVVEPVT